MANVTYDLQWKESMVELLDQLEVLDPTAGEELQKQVEGLDKDEKFQHFATLYIRYLQIFRKVEESYDMIVHPQKRMDIRKALEAVMGRVLEVKCLLIELNKGVSFVNLDDILVDLKLAPDVLEVPGEVLFYVAQALLAVAVALTLWSGWEFFRDLWKQRHSQWQSRYCYGDLQRDLSERQLGPETKPAAVPPRRWSRGRAVLSHARSLPTWG